jgi:hypothetical protein
MWSNYLSQFLRPKSGFVIILKFFNHMDDAPGAQFLAKLMDTVVSELYFTYCGNHETHHPCKPKTQRLPWNMRLGSRRYGQNMLDHGGILDITSDLSLTPALGSRDSTPSLEQHPNGLTETFSE